VPWDRVDSDNAHEAVYIIDGKPVRNGDRNVAYDNQCFSSKEMVSNPNACANPDEVINELRSEFDARIVG
jgi:hypothetical protein